MAEGFKGFLDWVGYPVGKIAGSANADLTGVRGVGGVGDITATGIAEAVEDGGGSRRRRRPNWRRPQAALVRLRGVIGHARVGFIDAVGAAVVYLKGVAGHARVGIIKAFGLGEVDVDGAPGAKGRVGTTVAVGSANVLLTGVRGRGNVGDIEATKGLWVYTTEELNNIIMILDEAA